MSKKEVSDMKIEASKTYRMAKITKDEYLDYGTLPGTDVKRILKGYSYDEEFDLWFSKGNKIGYELEEA